MWQRFTESARRTVFYAQHEAGRMGTKDVASEHLLIGLLCQVQDQREQQEKVWPPAPTDRVKAADVASRLLAELGLELDAVRAEVSRQKPGAASVVAGDAILTRDAKRVIDLSYNEAQRFPVPHIGTEHLLLGLISERGGLAGRILARHGADIARARASLAGAVDVPIAGTPGFWKRLFGGA